MKKSIIAASILFFLITLLAVSAYADLETFLSNLNIQAKADLNSFSIRLAAQFGVPLPKVKSIIETVETSADAFMCLQLSRMTKKQPEMVVQTYKNNKGKGWGVIAKELGIKPGSAEFHAIKSGNFTLSGESGGSAKGEAKKKGKGHKK